jgi:hypothetical protein
MVYFRTVSVDSNHLLLIMDCIVVSQIHTNTLLRSHVCKLLVPPLVVSYLILDNAPAGQKHVGDIVQQLVYPSLRVHSWFALIKDKMHTVETRGDKRDNWLFSLSVFTHLTADCTPVLLPYLIGMQVLPTFVVPYFAYITNYFLACLALPFCL